MARTTTKYVDLRSLTAQGSSSAIVVRLMMACNDLSVANEGLGQWKKPQSPLRRERQRSAELYFARVQMAHLYEGMKVIEAIRNDPYLLSLVGQCDARTQKSFQDLEQFLPDGAQNARFTSLVEKIRHNVIFHYDQSGKLISRALTDRASRPESRTSTVTRGDSVFYWNFTLADEIMDSIVVRQFWGIPRTVDTQTAADEVVSEIHKIFLSFMDFSGEYIWKYLEG